ncbi:MAG: ABC transporter permease [Dehalococcoidia bacterium]|nr:ABC transporter permease [Dehalococcoidia bacterium]
MDIQNTTRTRWAVLIGLSILFFVFVSQDSLWESMLRTLFPDEAQVLHPRASLLTLVLQHIALIAISSVLTITVAVPLGIFVTRRYGQPFLPITNDLTALGQTFPPVAVLALAVPLMGFGLRPTVLALFLYGLLPVVRNTVAGLLAVPADIEEAARGIGMTGLQILLKVELPLAARIILAGVRTSVVINVGTAMVGAVIGAGGLGSPIVAGLIQDNLAFIIEGALPSAMLALLLDQSLAGLETLFPERQTQE